MTKKGGVEKGYLGPRPWRLAVGFHEALDEGFDVLLECFIVNQKKGCAACLPVEGTAHPLPAAKMGRTGRRGDGKGGQGVKKRMDTLFQMDRRW